MTRTERAPRGAATPCDVPGDHDANSPDVALVIIAFNEADKIRRTIFSALAQTGAGQLEVIVVDDGSTDGTDRIVQSIAMHEDRVRLVRLPSNQGRGAARQAGVEAASATYLGFVDADIVLPSSWLVMCLQALSEHDAVAGTAVPDGDVAYCYGLFDLQPKLVPQTTAVTGSNALFRRDLFESVSFDPALRNGEDVKLGEDMVARGFRTHTVPGLVVRHHETKGYAASLRWLFESGRGASRQLVRDRRIRRPDVVSTAFGLLALAGGARLVRRKDPRLIVVAAAMPAVASAAHLHTKFHLARTPVRSVCAELVHTPLMTAYLLGRFVGYVDEFRKVTR